MVLFYGLLALETANNTVGSHRKQKTNKKMSSASNSWIYTQDLRKRFEERHADYRYIFIPVYINEKQGQTTGIIPDNSWMYTRSLRNHLYNSTSKISLPLTTNFSSSICCETNHGFMRDDLSIKTNSKMKISSAKELIEEDDEIENCSIPLIKHALVTSTNQSSVDHNTTSDTMKTSTKHFGSHNNRLTRLRSFFFKSSSSSLSGTRQ